MPEQTVPQTNQSEANLLKQIDNFYFIIFQPNPVADIVHIWIDDGSLSMILMRDRFYNLIRAILGESAESSVHKACTDYGDFFYLDRQRGMVKPLNNVSEKNFLNLSKLHDDIEAAKGDTSDYNFFGRVQDYLAGNDQFITPVSHPKNKPIVNASAGYADYSGRLGAKPWTPFSH